jgi:hypothetical protein
MEILLGWEIWPRVEDSLSSDLGREKHTTCVGERGNHKRKILYEVERVVQNLHKFFRMYAGCSGISHVHTRVAVGTTTYIHTSSSR